MDDITFCMSDCQRTDCYRHPSNIQDRTIPHSYADFKETETCPEFAKDINVTINDCIDRHAAIDAICKTVCGRGYCGTSCDYAMAIYELPSVQPDKDMIHLQKEQAYMQGWEDGRNALREEIWEDERDRLD